MELVHERLQGVPDLQGLQSQAVQQVEQWWRRRLRGRQKEGEKIICENPKDTVYLIKT